MSAVPPPKPVPPLTVPDFMKLKSQGRKITMLTAYDCLWAAMLDEAGIDSILVGDSLGMVFQGRDTTLPVTLEQMIYHGEIVVRSVRRALVIVDLPFLSYHVSSKQGVRSAGRILKETGAAAVKLEGGVTQARTIEHLANSDIPVMAHVGMRPQSVRRIGKMSAVQRDEKSLMADALAAQEAGAFSVLLELVPREIAKNITAALSVPTIGIGAGPDCDGQVLVTPDVFGLSGFSPKFMKKYVDLRGQALDGTRAYIEDVRNGSFPGPEHSHA